MFFGKKDVLKEGEKFLKKELSALFIPDLEHQGRSWRVGEQVDGMAYVEGKFDSGMSGKGAIRMYRVESDGESGYAIVRIMFFGERQHKIYLLSMEKTLMDASMRFRTKAMEIIDTFNATDEDKELLKSKLREE